MLAKRRLRKPGVRPGPRRGASEAGECACASCAGRTGEAVFRTITVPAGSPGRLAAFNVCKRGPGSITVPGACGLRDVSLFIVTQQFAGGLVDEMDPAARRAGHGFIAIRMIARRDIRHVNLDVHAGPGAAEYQFAHLLFSYGARLGALICLKIARIARPRARRGRNLIFKVPPLSFDILFGLWIRRRPEPGDKRIVGWRRSQIA